MYRIYVVYPGLGEARETCYVARASETLTAISDLLAQHHGCERLVIWLNETRLFAVDCQGNRIQA
jgi:hypothetical protein